MRLSNIKNAFRLVHNGFKCFHFSRFHFHRLPKCFLIDIRLITIFECKHSRETNRKRSHVHLEIIFQLLSGDFNESGEKEQENGE